MKNNMFLILIIWKTYKRKNSKMKDKNNLILLIYIKISKINWILNLQIKNKIKKVRDPKF